MQASLSTELDKVRDEKSTAKKKAISNEDLYKRSQEYNMSLQQYNSRLQSDHETTNEAHKRLETEKSTIVENLSNVRGHNKALQEQFSSLKASQDEATNQKEIFANELKCLREELKQIRDDRDRPQGQVHSLTGEVAKYKEYTGKSCAQLDTLTTKTNALEETCTSQREQINMLQQQLIDEREKLKNYCNPLSLVNGRKSSGKGKRPKQLCDRRGESKGSGSCQNQRLEEGKSMRN